MGSSVAKSPQLAGFTLFELVVVMAIVGLLAVVATPTREGVNEARVGAAATEVAQALRFARDLSLSENKVYAVDLDVAQERVRVLRIDTTPTPPVAVYDVRHPLSKWLWDVDFDDFSPAKGVDMSVSATFFGACSVASGLATFASGELIACNNPLGVRLDSATYTLTRGDASTTVVVDGLTGRVSRP